MLRILVYKCKERHYIYPLGCCAEHQEKGDVFTTGEEEEIFTISPSPDTPPLDTLRELMAELDKRGITEVDGLTIILDNAWEDDVSHRTPHTVH
jgi:hypothetical protein